LGTESGANGNHLVIAAGPRNKIRTLSDLRGHKLTCTRPDSITGYRAAIAVLSQEAGMRPDVDYSINFSHGQKRSLGGLLAGNFEVAALSDDKIQQLVKAEELKPADLRVIYDSQVIPRLTLGHAHQLDDPLADKIKSATLAFENQQGPVDELSGKPLRFMPADYRKDFEFVRRIDDCFDPRLHKWSKEKSSPPCRPRQTATQSRRRPAQATSRPFQQPAADSSPRMGLAGDAAPDCGPPPQRLSSGRWAAGPARDRHAHRAATRTPQHRENSR